MMRRIKIDWGKLPHFEAPENPFREPRRELPETGEISLDAFPDFLEQIGLVGMGGSGFKTAGKIRASKGAHTLIINGVECEPGITIDQTILLHHAKWVKEGANASAQAIGAKRIVLAVKNKKKLVSQLGQLYPYDFVELPDRYPAGAEKLIIEKLEGKMPPPGTRPYQQGYLVQNVVSLRAIGRALLDGIPVVERPLTLTMPSAKFYKNIIVPVNILVWDILQTYDLPYDPEKHLIVASGLMMGNEISSDECVEKTTTSLIIIERKKIKQREHDCIRCGACNNVCPLGLHPFMLAESIQQNHKEDPVAQAELTECFLCGACSAVCPSNIPLVQAFMEGKR